MIWYNFVKVIHGTNIAMQKLSKAEVDFSLNMTSSPPLLVHYPTNSPWSLLSLPMAVHFLVTFIKILIVTIPSHNFIQGGSGGLIVNIASILGLFSRSGVAI